MIAIKMMKEKYLYNHDYTLHSLFYERYRLFSGYRDICLMFRGLWFGMSSFRFREKEMVALCGEKNIMSRIRYARCSRNTKDDLGHRFHPQGHYFPVMSARILGEFGLLPGIARGKSVI